MTITRTVARLPRQARLLAGLSVIVLLAAAVSAAPPTAADQRVNAAISAAQTQAPSKALPLLEEVARTYPFHPAMPEVLFILGSIYLDMDRLEDARANFAKLEKFYGAYAASIPRVDDARVGLARILAAEGKYAEALQAIDAFIAKNPRSRAILAARFAKGEILVKKGDLEAAHKYLDPIAADARNPMREAALFMLSELAARANDNAAVEKMMQELLKTSKDETTRNNALFKLGEIYRDSGNVQKALDTFRRVQATDDSVQSRLLNASVLLEVAQTFEKLKHPLEACIAFEGIATFYPDTALATDAWNRAILAATDYGDVQRAEQLYQAFLTNYPGNTQISAARLYMSQHEMQAGHYANAIRQLQAGLQEFPTSEWVETMYVLLGDAYLSAKQYADAEKTLKEFADRFPNSEQVPESYMMLGEGFIEQDRFEQGIGMIENVAREYSQREIGKQAAERSQEARMQYASWLADTNRIEDAVAELKQVTAPGLMEQAHLLSAQILAQGGKFDEAAAELREFLEQYPRSPLRGQALASMAEAQMQNEQYGEAVASLQELLDLHLPATNPLLPAATLQLAFCRYYQDDTDGMSTTLTSIVTLYPSAPEAGEALYWLGYLRRTKQDYEGALGYYTRLRVEYPTHPLAPEATYQAGEAAALNNDAAAAITAFTNVYMLYPQTIFAPYALMRGGEIYLGLQSVDTWLKDLAALPAPTPLHQQDATIARAGVLMRAGDVTNARAVLAKVDLRMLPDEVHGYALAIGAGIANGLGRFGQAEQEATQADALIGARPVGRDEALFQKARAQQGQQKWDDAEATYARLLSEVTIANAQLNAQAFIERADCLYRLDRTDEVQEIVDEGIRLRPPVEQTARAVVLKGDAMLKRNEYQKAAQFYKRATILYGKIEEFAVPAYRGLIICYTKLGLTAEAQKAREDFARSYPHAQQE